MADESQPVGERAPKRKAKDNPWYRLATLHGQPSHSDDEIAAKNRVTWNRWMATGLPADLKTTLLAKGWTGEELTPFSDDELRDIKASTGLLTPDDYFIDFSNTEFEDPLFASRFIFLSASFGSASFAGYASFGSASFGFANFGSATFAGYADFGSASFANFAHFGSASFAGYAYFRSASFAGYADFGSASFAGFAIFGSATFAARVSFVNAEMKNATDFDDVTFGQPPECFNTKLHEGTTWHGVGWPAPPQDAALARQFVNAYERLKLEMDKLKKHGDELDFFALEQQCRRVVLGRWQGLPIAVYGFLSDYGRSYTRPLLVLVATVLIGTVLFVTSLVPADRRQLPDVMWSADWREAVAVVWSADWRQALGLSFASTLSVFGKALVKPEIFLGLSDGLKAVSVLQSILGLVLLFLFGLGIRNRFRMK